MTQISAPLVYEYHVAIGHPHAPRLLLLPGDDGWRLPSFTSDERRFWQDVAHVNRAVADHYAAEVITLRCLTIDYERDFELLSKVYAVDLRDPAWSPPAGAVWASRDDLGQLKLAIARHAEVAVEWFSWRTTIPPASRPPWYLPGWYDEAGGWLAAQLAALGLERRGPIEQQRSWQRSAILRALTDAGPVYFKAVPPIFGHEPALTAALAAADPKRFAAPLAIDNERGWLLMRGLGGRGLNEQPDLETWQAALRSFAEVQIATAKRVGQLRAIGVPERPLMSLADQAETLLADVSATLPGQPAGLSAEQHAALAALAPRLRSMCDELARYGLPAALEHGDFWAGQIIGGEAGYAFIDWSDSSIAHPFFSLLLFLIEIDDYFPKVPDVRDRLRDAYLGPWAVFAPHRRLVRAFELAQPLAALHHALTYHKLVLPHMEVKWEMELMLPFYLKMLLRLATP